MIRLGSHGVGVEINLSIVQVKLPLSSIAEERLVLAHSALLVREMSVNADSNGVRLIVGLDYGTTYSGEYLNSFVISLMIR